MVSHVDNNKREIKLMSENNSYTIKLESQKLNGENRYLSCDMVEELGLFEAMKVRDFVKDLIKKRCPHQTLGLFDERIEAIKNEMLLGNKGD
jgi:hypothetical protein